MQAPVGPAAVRVEAAVAGDDGQREEPDEQEEFKVFVGGLPWSIEERVLRKDFSECGRIVDLRLLTDKETGRSRGMAFITFADRAGLEAALKYDGDSYGGRTLKVGKAEGRKGGKDGKGKAAEKGKGKGKAPGAKPPGCTSVVLKGLAFETTEEDLWEAFGKCGGGPSNVSLLKDRETGASRGMGFVDFDAEDAVDEAMKLSGTELQGRRLRVDYARPRAGGAGGGAMS